MNRAAMLGRPRFRTGDYTLHAWDLARAIGADDVLHPVAVLGLFLAVLAEQPGCFLVPDIRSPFLVEVLAVVGGEVRTRHALVEAVEGDGVAGELGRLAGLQRGDELGLPGRGGDDADDVPGSSRQSCDRRCR